MNLQSLTGALVLLLITTVYVRGEDVHEILKKPFPMWTFCIAYQVREADERDARPVDPEDEKDPLNDADQWIPHLLRHDGGIVDMAALSMRVVKSRILNHGVAESVIRDSTLGEKHHPIIESRNPRHLFVFYAHHGQPVAAIEVDFEYNRVRMQPEVRPNQGRDGTSETADLAALAKIAMEAGLDLKPFAASLDDYVERLDRLDERQRKSIEELQGKYGAEMQDSIRPQNPPAN